MMHLGGAGWCASARVNIGTGRAKPPRYLHVERLLEPLEDGSESRDMRCRSVADSHLPGCARRGSVQQRKRGVVERVYIVRHGDALRSISKKVLGSPSRWLELAQLNAVAAPYTIFTGQLLKVPSITGATPSSAASQQLSLATEPPTAGTAIARGFSFVFMVEQLPDVGNTHLIRKVAVVPSDFSHALNLSVREWRAGLPERFGIEPNARNGATTIAEHVQDINRMNSPYTSTSNKPFGAATMQGRPVLIDTAKVRAAGGTIYEPRAIVHELRAFVARNPGSSQRVETLIRAITDFEGETLIEGRTPRAAVSKPNVSQSAYVKTAEQLFQEHRNDPAKLAEELKSLEGSYKGAAKLAKGLRLVGTVGVVLTAVDLTKATSKSIHQGSFKPIGAETIRQVGGWGAGWAGAKIGAVAGAALGIETGPGAILSGAVGAIVFGAGGYFGFDWVADKIDAN